MVPTQRFRQMRFSPVSLWIVAKLLKHSLTATDQVAVKSAGSSSSNWTNLRCQLLYRSCSARTALRVEVRIGRSGSDRAV